MTDWKTLPATGLEYAIAEFKAKLPGWWFSVGDDMVSRIRLGRSWQKEAEALGWPIVPLCSRKQGDSGARIDGILRL